MHQILILVEWTLVIYCLIIRKAVTNYLAQPSHDPCLAIYGVIVKS